MQIFHFTWNKKPKINRGNFIRFIIFIFLLIFMLPYSVTADEEKTAFKTTPVTNNGKKWRIGYYEGGPYSNYQSVLRVFIENTANLGWMKIPKLPVCRNEIETETLWKFLVSQIESEYLEFVPDAYWSANWDESLRKIYQSEIISRANEKNDIDIMLALGTWAGQDLANNRHRMNTMIMSTSDPVSSGISKSYEDSGFDHIHTGVDLSRLERPIRMFYDIVKFQKLGVPFQNDAAGKSYAGMSYIKQVAEEYGFEIVECHLDSSDSGVVKEEEELVRCSQELAPQVDAIYLTDYGGLTNRNLNKILTPLMKNRVPMFAQTRYELVGCGILMSVARDNYEVDGRFYANIFSGILNGAKPRSLPQQFEGLLQIAINLETAKQIGFRFPIDVLAAAHKIYDDIRYNCDK